ncbi:6-phosphofructokinase 1 [Nematocida minor]|uniref:6-phosphofructokinase 1 n=1 Tax=Nematocida minor TaxID=1912983 RepID=UPI00221EA40F|nr:6-phosphofructokinase 1 [Nematocida minor]KAI5192310.1 6-phosphofructokinase 1 [Nematocida minor]
MVKIEFIFDTKKKRNEVKEFYESLGLVSSVQKNLLRIKGTEQTSIVSAAQSKISLRAKNHREILETHKDLLRDLETVRLEDDVEIAHSYRDHHIPFRIKMMDPLGNDVCISPALSPKTLGIITSGGDAPGMNSAIWAIVKASTRNGARVLGVQNGYEGLIKNEIQEITEQEAFQHMQTGGTFLRSARSEEFTTKEGLKKAVSTIKKREIDALVIIGGDGTMKGAGSIAEACPEISVVFVPGSIDNDIPGTESIGAATALHRIIEAIDCIESTMASHKRGFVLEVMGRDCGWLALTGAFATDASYVFLPEYPQGEEWKEKLQKSVTEKSERHCTYVILSEGARHKSGEKVTAEEVCQAMSAVGIETRSVVLGHTQRGGSPCAADRLIAPSLGVAAAEVALSRPGAYAIYTGDTERVLDLFVCINRCIQFNEIIKKEPDGVAKVRGKEFVEMYESFESGSLNGKQKNCANGRASKSKKSKDSEVKEGKETDSVEVSKKEKESSGSMPNYAVAMIGLVGAGADTILSKMEYYASARMKKVVNLTKHTYFIKRNSKIKKSELETDLLHLKEIMNDKKIGTIVLIGGLDALAEGKRLSSVFENVYVIPCTVSNNVPGTTVSIGADTALDTITALCDNLKIELSRSVAYLVEVHGGACGYLSVATALAVGALDCYFPEETGVLSRLTRSLKALGLAFKKSSIPQLIIRGNGAMKGICNDTAARILEVDGTKTYIVRQCTLGHVQKGNKPTAVDRLRAARTALFIFSAPAGHKVLGVNRWTPMTTEIEAAVLEVNEEKRRLKRAAWLEMARTYRVLN